MSRQAAIVCKLVRRIQETEAFRGATAMVIVETNTMYASEMRYHFGGMNNYILVSNKNSPDVQRFNMPHNKQHWAVVFSSFVQAGRLETWENVVSSTAEASGVSALCWARGVVTTQMNNCIRDVTIRDGKKKFEIAGKNGAFNDVLMMLLLSHIAHHFCNDPAHMRALTSLSLSGS